MNKLLFPKLALLALIFPLVFTACDKNNYKSFLIGETSGDGVQHRTDAYSCTHPGTAVAARCELDINEDGNNDLTFLHSQNANSENVTTAQGPSGLSLVIDSAFTARGTAFPRELDKDTELNSNNWWFELSKDVRKLNFKDLGGDNEGYYAFRWGTNTQRRYGWIKLRKVGTTDFVIDEWAFQQAEQVEE